VDKCGHGYNCMIWLQNKIDDIQQTSIRIPASGKVERHSYSSVIGRPIDTIAKHMYNDYSRFTGRYSCSIDSVPVEPPLQPWQGRTDERCQQADQHRTYIECTRFSKLTQDFARTCINDVYVTYPLGYVRGTRTRLASQKAAARPSQPSSGSVFVVAITHNAMAIAKSRYQ
jgi:hypothetical protein